MLQAQDKGPLTHKRYLNALAKNQRLARAEGIDAVLFKYNLDALVAPTARRLDDRLGQRRPDFSGPDTTSAAAVAGYPHITVPAWVCVWSASRSVLHRNAWQEPRIIRLAYAFEQAWPARRPPQFLPSVEFPR